MTDRPTVAVAISLAAISLAARARARASLRRDAGRSHNSDLWTLPRRRRRAWRAVSPGQGRAGAGAGSGRREAGGRVCGPARATLMRDL